MRDQPEGPDSRDSKAIQTVSSSQVFKVRDEPVTRATEDTKRTHHAPEWGRPKAEATHVVGVTPADWGARTQRLGREDNHGTSGGGDTGLGMRSSKLPVAT